MSKLFEILMMFKFRQFQYCVKNFNYFESVMEELQPTKKINKKIKNEDNKII